MLCQYDENIITDTDPTKGDRSKTIDQMKNDSVPEPDGIPNIFLKNSERIIAKPVMLILRQSLDKISIAGIHKLTYVSP